jgi:alpha-mannosidase
LLFFGSLKYEKASIDFSNIDVMIGATMKFQAWDMVDVRSVFGPRFHRVNMFYSNPDYYAEQKRLESKTIRFPVKTDDFFPYSDCPHCFWTGYFTSRTAFKRYGRVASSLLLATRQIDSLYGGLISSAKKTATTKQESTLFPLEDALGVAQHHDAISGTAKQHVADDYSFRLSNGIDQAVQHVSSILRAAMFATDDMTMSTQIDDLVYCPLLNETKCAISEVGMKRKTFI